MNELDPLRGHPSKTSGPIKGVGGTKKRTTPGGGGVGGVGLITYTGRLALKILSKYFAFRTPKTHVPFIAKMIVDSLFANRNTRQRNVNKI